MAYCRFSESCDWYVFWQYSKPDSKADELLAIWHTKSKDAPSFKYVEVLEMLNSKDFSRIPGFEESSRDLLKNCMMAFIYEIDKAHDFST